MVIYGEYLFLENFVAGIMILFFTGKILGVNPSLPRLLFCGCCCGGYAFILFLPFGGLVSWICKGGFSLLMAAIAYGATTGKRLLYGAAVFLGVTIFYGGIAIAFLTSFSRTGVTAAAGIYMPPLTYVSVMLAATIAALFLWFLLSLLKAKRVEMRRIMETELVWGSKRWKMKGFIDTGNDLADPLTGRPVCIIDRPMGERILAEAVEEVEITSRYRMIPYRAVGVSHGMLDGYRVDAIVFPDGFTVKNPVLAFCEEGHFQSRRGEREILLPAAMLERGIYGDC